MDNCVQSSDHHTFDDKGGRAEYHLKISDRVALKTSHKQLLCWYVSLSVNVSISFAFVLFTSLLFAAIFFAALVSAVLASTVLVSTALLFASLLFHNLTWGSKLYIFRILSPIALNCGGPRLINFDPIVQVQGENIRHYYNYLIQRVKAYKDTQTDWVKDGKGRLKKQTIDKGLLRETEVVQKQIYAVLKCEVLLLPS